MILRETSLPAEAQPFSLVDDFTTFSVEYTEKPSVGDHPDFHFHFFVTPEVRKLAQDKQRRYWAEQFPAALDQVARSFFGYDFPRLQAQRIPDVLRSDDDKEPQDSWWLLVQQLEVGAFPIGDSYAAKISRFLEALDQALEISIRT